MTPQQKASERREIAMEVLLRIIAANAQETAVKYAMTELPNTFAGASVSYADALLEVLDRTAPKVEAEDRPHDK